MTTALGVDRWLRIKMDSALNRLCSAPHNVLVVMIVERLWLWRVEIT
jgi:hypothetical protein